MRKIIFFAALFALMTLFFACNGNSKPAAEAQDSTLTTVKHPEWSRNAVIYEINWRQMTDEGTAEAMEAELPRLKDLGVDILWLMPVYPISELNRKGELGSYYASQDFKGVNPELGTKEQLKHFIDKAHEAGFKVILDWVPNHTGCDNAWVTEHPEYYAHNDSGAMYGPYDWTDVYKLDYNNPGTKAAMTDALLFWIKEMGMDGFRCDVAAEVPVSYWDSIRPILDAAKEGGVFMLAEASVPALQKNAFDMGYNWPMKDLFSQIAATSGQYTFKEHSFPVKHAAAIDSLLADQDKEYPGDTYLMNMITNHDLNSWEGTEFERLGNLQGAFAVLSYTLPGMPLIYTGQETGMNRAFEFFKKDKAPEFEPRNEYFEFYKKLNALKHREPALLAGNEGGKMERYATSSPDLYVFSREVDGRPVVVFVNLGAEKAYVEFEEGAPAADGMTDYFTGEAAAVPSEMEPGQYIVWTK